MATEFMNYRDDKGFNISDVFMQLVIYYIQEELKKPQYIFSNKNLFIIGHEGIINGYQNGFLALPWKNIIVDINEEQIMIQILQTVKSSLRNKGDFITVSELQSIQTEDEYFKHFYSKKPFPVEELIKIIDALIEMIQGTWTFTNYDMEILYY
ncbi:hypothetical protein [Flavobacterium sp.]|jgi:hypothetical protein|uniref:hypothetical protein n=1 Tax=Flavobacterium sp. TaxID=239 RepID=UPI003785161E